MKHLIQHFNNLTLHPKNAKALKGLILQLAVQGKLSENWRAEHPDVESGDELLKKADEEKKLLVEQKQIKKEKKLTPISIKEKLKYSLPNNWAIARLGNIGDWGAGATPLRSNPEFYGGEINWFKSGELNNSIINYESREKITELALKKTSVRLNKPGDVLIAMYGATIGKTSLLDVEGTTNQAVCACTPFKCIKSEYLHLLLKALKQVFLNQGEGGAQPNISRVKIRNQIFLLPPLQEQKAIVAIVEELFAEVEQLEQKTKERIQLKKDYVTSALHKLSQTNDVAKTWQDLQTHFATFFNEKANIKSLRESILQLAVQGKLTKNWREKLRLNGAEVEPASELLKRINAEKKRLIEAKAIKKEKPLPEITEDEKPFELPEGWVWCRMQDLCPNISSGSTPPKPYFKETGIPYLKVYNIRDQKIDFGYKQQYLDKKYHNTKLRRSILKPGDVIMNIVGPPLGKVAVIPNTHSEWNCNQAISFFKPIDKSLSTWLYTFLLAGTFLKHIELIGTAGQDNISVTKSKMIMIPIPPLEEQKAIVELVDELMAYCDGLEREVEQRDNLLEDLMASCLVEMEGDSAKSDVEELGMVAEDSKTYTK